MAALLTGFAATVATWAAPAQAATTTQTAPTDPNIFVACGYGYVVVSGSPACDGDLPTVLGEVLADNAASAPAATIELLPGRYCPTDITAAAKAADTTNTHGTLYRKLTIAGVGDAAYLDDTSPSSSTGFEAARSTFVWSETYCGDSTHGDPLINITSGYSDSQAPTLRNLTVDGDHDAPTGIYAQQTGLRLRDIVVQNTTSRGLDYGNGTNMSLQVDASAFVGNSIAIKAAEVGTIEGSTITDNTVGLSVFGYDLHLYNDTIVGNDTGIYPSNPSTTLGVANTIMLGNSINRGGTGTHEWWETGEGTSGNNLIGPDADGTTYSCPVDNTYKSPGVTTDVSTTDTVMPTTLAESGITPHFPTPNIASGLGGLCRPTDQREVIYAVGDPCDIGSVNASSGSPEAAVDGGGTANVGSMHVGDSTTESTGFSVATGLVGFGDVTLDDHDGAFTLASQGCTLAVLTANDYSCNVRLVVAPVAVGVATTTLTVKSTTGDVTLQISVTGTPPPPATLTVTRTDDPAGAGTCLDADGDDCSLRQAIAAIAPGGTITLGAHEYTLTQDELHVDQPMTITGAGADHTSISQRSDVDPDGTGNKAEVLWIDGADGVTIRGVDLGGGGGHNGGPGQYGSAGGGIYARDAGLTLDHVRVDGNYAIGAGGGIFAQDAQLAITHSEITLNALTGSLNSGGAIFADDSEVTIDNTTIDRNNAGAPVSFDGTAAPGNAANGIGGGIYLTGTTTVDASFVTIADNYAHSGDAIVNDTSGGGEGDGPATPPGVTLRDSIIFSGPNASTNTGAALCGGHQATTGGHNLATDSSCYLTDPTDQEGTAFSLYLLDRNGGQTFSMAPHSDGPAVDAASDADCAAYATDQRDLARPQGGHCDVGAVEVAQSPGGGPTDSASPSASPSSSTPPPAGSGPSSPTPSATATPEPHCTTAPFGDVPTDGDFCGVIDWLLTHHIATGYPDGGFHPTASVSRQALATFLYRLTHDGADVPACSSAPFSDVPATGQFCGAIAWLQTTGLSTGYADGSFRPGNDSSRQAIAAFLYRLTHDGHDAPACSSTPFPDVPATGQFCGAIAWLQATGLSTGYADGSFQPGNDSSRQAIAAFLYRYSQGA